MKKKAAKKRSPVFTVLLVVLLSVFLYSGYRFATTLSGYLEGRQLYKQTAGEFVDDSPDAGADEKEKEESGPFKTKPPISVDWDKLQAQNPEVVGWIYSEDTIINYPVLQASDNDKYLHTMIDGRYNFAGSIFLDCDCSPDLTDFVTILYGHHMNDGSMFASLHNYTKQDYYDKHPVLWYLTPTADYRLDVYAGYVEKPDASVYELFWEREEFDEFLLYAAGKSNFKTMKEFSSIDIGNTVVLSTCAYEFNNARYLLVTVPVMVR